MIDTTRTVARPNLLLTYAGVVGVPVAILLLVIHFGGLSAVTSVTHGAASTTSSRTPAAGLPDLALLMAQIVVILLLSRSIGTVFERIGQPRVIGEMLAGILLGPSLLGWVAPGLSAFLFPQQSLRVLHALSQLGLVLFMFMVGLELDLKEVRRQGHLAVLISHASISVPMALGSVLALYLFPRVSLPNVDFAGFALFMGVAMSITAFPVLARILSERKMLRTPMGSIAVACAAVDDVTGWCVLAYIVIFVRASHAGIPVWATVAAVPLFIAIMFLVGSRALRGFERAYQRHGHLSDNYKALMLMFLLASALITESLGLHLLFGAFIAGAVMPKEGGVATYAIEKFESLTVILLLPLFFAFTGLRTSIGQVRGPEMWGICLLIILVAVAGKLGGTAIAARIGGLKWRESLALGSLMNTRGLMELVVLNIGLDIKVISPQMFSMMVVMAIATTMMTPPLLHWTYPLNGETETRNPEMSLD